MSWIALSRYKGYKIFALAMFASFLWHIFWLSAISIVSDPGRSGPVKFSKVSFLGPILGKSSTELQSRPKERSFLEMRYLGRVKQLPFEIKEAADMADDRYGEDADTRRFRDEGMVASIDDVLSRDKLEPAGDTE
jgi:hypothetical protein